MLQAAQGAGDWSDAPTPDLVIAVNAGRRARSTFDLGSRRFAGVMGSNEVIVIAPEVASTILMDDAHVCRALAVPYRNLVNLAADRGGALPGDGDFGRLHGGFVRDPALTNVLEQLWRHALREEPHSSLYVEGALLQIAALLMAHHSGRVERAQGGLASWQVKRATEYMVANLERDVSLAELSAQVDLSPHHFCRAFKQSIGASPHVWFSRLRIERAQDIIAAHPSAGLTEVALRVGFSSQSAFGTAFRRVTGTTPSAWRRERLC
jgi:AraC family transcriptional regulator